MPARAGSLGAPQGFVISDDQRVVFPLHLPDMALVVVVRAEAVRERVESLRAARGAKLTFRISMSDDGELLSDQQLPRLRVRFANLESEATAQLGVRSFYGWSLLFVIPLTFAGGISGLAGHAPRGPGRRNAITVRLERVARAQDAVDLDPDVR